MTALAPATTTEPVRETTVAPAEPTVREVLHRAADLLEEFGWCQGYFAEDSAGEWVEEDDAAAVAFCASGALLRAMADLNAPYMRSTNELLKTPPGFSHTPEWNDAPGRTKAEVVACLREAAEASR